MNSSFEHISVMAREVEGLLRPKAGAVIVDCTLGLGGHALSLAGLLGKEGRLIGIDQDDEAIARATLRLSGVNCRVDIIKSNFFKLPDVLKALNVSKVDGVLFDLGVSSLQLDDPQRGFSFREEGPLDMRMDKSAPVSAYELICSLSEEELASLIWKYGEERFSRRIARVIVERRAARPIDTTKELADLVLSALPRGYQREKLHPATRTFQALRIAVNHELEVLEMALRASFDMLNIQGRMAVIAFHSLEDRIVKDEFRALARAGHAGLLTKKPLRPGEEESEKNPRSRSARLRALERIA